MFILKFFGCIVGIYAASRLSGIAIEWMKEGFEKLRPDRYRQD